MKRRSAFLALALGLVAGLFACQDGGVSAPFGLEPQFAKPDCDVDDSHPSCKPDDGGTTPQMAYMTWAGALTGDGEVEVGTDTPNALKAWAPAEVTMKFTATQALFEHLEVLPSQCTVDPVTATPTEIRHLAEKLVDASATTTVPGSRVDVDLSRLESRKNLIGINYFDERWAYSRWIKRAKLAPEYGNPRVDQYTTYPLEYPDLDLRGDLVPQGTTVLKITGGAVAVWQKAQLPRDPSYTLVCRNQDEVWVEVVRIP